MPEIHNPNLQSQGSGGAGGGGDMRSTVTFMLLVIVAFFAYQYFFAKPQPEQQAPAPTPTQSQSAAPAQAASAPSPAKATAGTAQSVATPVVTAAAESETTVENELYKIVFTNRGARVKHWILKKYLDDSGKPLDLVQTQASQRFGLPLSLFTYEPALTSQLNEALYQVNVQGAQAPPAGSVLAPAALSFHYAANGVDAVKTIHFNTSYVVSIDTQVTRDGIPVRALVEWPAGLGDMEEFSQSSMLHAQARTPSYFAWALNGKSDSQAASKVSGNNTLNAPYQYAAVMDLFFAAAFMPATPEDTTVVTLHNAIDLPGDPNDPNSKKTPADVLGIAVGSATGATHLRLFAGPKATDVLKSIHGIGASGKPDGPSLEPLIRYGWWTIIAKPLYVVLRFMVEHGVGNWGWAILLFTLIFTLALLPTRLMMTKSSLKMMRIQPKLDAIKKRYANLKINDPKRAEMQQEQMAIMKAEGVNMYGGCLPMLLQMPLFFAYYAVLENAVELRQAHWLWLPDLSQPDPTHILPFLIIITMFLTQYITPSPGMDPAQRRMMAFMMPIFFGFMLWHYASGLALYWATSNVIYLSMQIGINQSHIGKEMHALAARRGAGKKKSGIAGVLQGRR